MAGRVMFELWRSVNPLPTTYKETDESLDIFMIWKINSGLVGKLEFDSCEIYALKRAKNVLFVFLGWHFHEKY